MHRWHLPYGRKWRTKESLDESERGEWKSWLKTQHSEYEDHGIWSHHFMANRWGNSGNRRQTLFLGSKSLQMVIAAMKLKDACSLEKSYDQPRHCIKKRDITLPTKVYLVKAMVFPVVMYGCESLKRKLSTKELMLLNCGIGEDSWESLGQQRDPTSPS